MQYKFLKTNKSFYSHGLKEAYIKFTLGVVEGFSVITPPNLNGFGWNLDYKCGTTVHTCKFFFLGGGGNRTRVRQMVPKWGLIFSVTNTMRPFGRLSCTDFDHVWNNRRELVSWSVYPWEISEFLCRGFARPKNCPRKQYFGGVLVTSVQLERQNFGW